MSAVESVDNRYDRFTVSSSNEYNKFNFHVYALDVDTIPVQSETGIMINFLKLQHVSKRLMRCYVPDETFQKSVVDAFNYMTTYLGRPANAFVEYVIPERTESMPGLIMTPQTACATEAVMEAVGGFDVVAGEAVGRQWFGSLLRPASDRETWIADAMPQYLSLMFIHQKLII